MGISIVPSKRWSVREVLVGHRHQVFPYLRLNTFILLMAENPANQLRLVVYIWVRTCFGNFFFFWDFFFFGLWALCLLSFLCGGVFVVVWWCFLCFCGVFVVVF